MIPIAFNIGTTGNDDTGQTLRSAFAELNDVFARVILVPAGTGTLTAAVAQIDEEGTEEAPIILQLAAGVIIEEDEIEIAGNWVSLRGPGINACKIKLGSGQILFTGMRPSLADFTAERDGSEAAAVIHIPCTGLSSYKHARMDRVRVRNDSGTAIGTFSGDAYDIEAFGKTAIDWLYGGRVHDGYIVGHDPTLGATSYAVRTLQGIAPVGGYPIFDAQENYISQRAGMFGCYIINADPDGVGVNGIRENEAGDRITLDWHLAGGIPSVSWYPPPLSGCYLIGAELEVPHGSSQHLIPHVSTGTGGILRGTLRVLNCEVYGFYLASYLNNSDVQGGMWVTSRGDYQAMKMVQGNSFKSVSFISGDNRVGYIDGLIRFGLETGNIFTNCHFQGETGFLFEGNQYQTQGCTEISFRDSEITHGQKRRIFGWEAREPQAVRLNGLGESYLRTAGTSNSYSVGLAGARTFEMWFRCDDDGGDSRLFTFDGDSLTTSTVLSVVPNTGMLYGYAGGVLVGNQALGFAGVGIGNSVWNHVAMVVTAGGVGTIYLNGVPIAGSAGSVPNVTGLGSFRIGVTNNGLSLFKGDITQIRISNVARYTANFSATLRTIAQDYIIDANTIGQWGNSTRKGLGWTDQMGLHDLEFGADPLTNVYAAPNLPYWVLRDRSLVWEHGTIP